MSKLCFIHKRCNFATGFSIKLIERRTRSTVANSSLYCRKSRITLANSSLQLRFSSAYAYGAGHLSALGMPSVEDMTIATQIPRLQSRQIVNASCGWGHSAFVDSDGYLYVCGRTHDFRNTLRHIRSYNALNSLAKMWNFLNYKLFQQDLEPRHVPLLESNESDSTEQSRIVKVVCSPGDLTAVLTEDGKGYAFGANTHGQCGFGVTSNSEYDLKQILPASRPTLNSNDVTTQSDEHEYEEDPFVDIALGFQYGIALTESGKLWSWGKGGRGQLGVGDNETYKAPVQIMGKHDELENIQWKQVHAGFSHAAAVTESGDVYVWGRLRATESISGRSERFDMDQWYPRPAELPTNVEAIAVACGQAHTAILASDGTVWQLGMRGRGIEFDSTDDSMLETATKDEYDPVVQLPVTDYVAQPIPITRCYWADNGAIPVSIRAGVHHTYVICNDGSVWRFGWKRVPELVFPLVQGKVHDSNETHPISVKDLALGFAHGIVIADTKHSGTEHIKTPMPQLERFFAT